MNFIYFSTLAWDEAGGAHNPTQMARALARAGHAVLFVEPQPSRTRMVQERSIEVVALTELGMSPIELRRAWFGLPTGDVQASDPSQAVVGQTPQEARTSGELETVAKNLLAHISAKEPRAAIYSAPFDPFVRLIPYLRAHNFLIVYYAMDDFAAAPALGYTQFVAGAEEYLVRASDGLFGVTQHIVNSLERFGQQAHIVENGIDLAAFQNNGSGNIKLTRGELTLGFWGTLMETMFDADLVAYTAESQPQWAIHLLGAPDPEPHRRSIRERLRKYPNIFFHGAVPHAELPSYAAAFNVALAPFPNNAFTLGRNPIKVYEYLAAHLPVVASYTPQLRKLPNVFVAQSPQEFVTKISDAARTSIDRAVLDKFLAQQSWDARAAEFLNIVRAEPLAARAKTDAEILPGFANPTKEDVMRYANALELELRQVQTWALELERAAQTRTSHWTRVKHRIRRGNKKQHESIAE